MWREGTGGSGGGGDWGLTCVKCERRACSPGPEGGATGTVAQRPSLKSGRHGDERLESIVSSVEKRCWWWWAWGGEKRKSGAQEWVIFPGAVKK